MLIAQLADGKVVIYSDETISPVLQRQLAEANIEFPKIDLLVNALQSHHVQFEVGHYKTYVFPSRPVENIDVACLSKHDGRVKVFGFDSLAENVYAIEKNNALISACVSTRENEKCGEAWVYTAPEYRYQGFAQKVVNTWAGSLLDAGKVPFYSHQIENAASANLAKKLGLQAVFEEISIMQV